MLSVGLLLRFLIEGRHAPETTMAESLPPTSSPESARPAASQDFQQAAEAPEPGIVREFIDFLATSKKWWLTPIILVVLLVAGLVLLAGSPAGPFLYSLW